MTTNFGGLVDAENGLISRRIFIEPQIYAQELERIFARCWLFLCHLSGPRGCQSRKVREPTRSQEKLGNKVPTI